MGFEVIGRISQQKTIATGGGIRELERLRKVYGPARWRKRQGVAKLRLADGSAVRAEVHCYEADGVGRKELKIKRILE